MIFSKKNTVAGNSKFIGAYLPQQLVEDIILLALVEEVSKTEMLRRFIQSGINNAYERCSYNKTHLTIASNAYWQFKADQTKKSHQRQYKNWHSFIIQCRDELKTKKKLKNTTVTKIMDALLEMKN